MTFPHYACLALILTLLAPGCATPHEEGNHGAAMDHGALDTDAHDTISGKAEKRSSGMRIALTSVFVDDPVKAHAFYTEVLGFQSKMFDPSGQLAIVVSADDPNGTALLLEPLGFAFAREYQEKVFQAGFPIIIFGVDDVEETIERLKDKGVKFRDDLDKKAWGLENMFEDSFGNLIMLQKNE